LVKGGYKELLQKVTSQLWARLFFINLVGLGLGWNLKRYRHHKIIQKFWRILSKEQMQGPTSPSLLILAVISPYCNGFHSTVKMDMKFEI